MRKYWWAMIAGGCVVAVLVVAGIVFIPGLLHRNPPPEVPEGHAILTPGHWWKADMTEQQLRTLDTLWGSDITSTQLLQQLWPEALEQMPPEAATAYETQRVAWPPEKYENWKGHFICSGASSPHEGGARLFQCYVGDPGFEQGTLVLPADRGFAEERIYRVSLYMDPWGPE